MKKRIRFSRKRQNFNLILGVVWGFLGTTRFFFNHPMQWTDYLWIVLGLGYAAKYLYEYTFQYLTIADGMIYKSLPFSKKIPLKDIRHIKQFAGGSTLSTDSQKLTIYKDLVHKESWKELELVFNELGLTETVQPVNQY